MGLSEEDQVRAKGGEGVFPGMGPFREEDEFSLVPDQGGQVEGGPGRFLQNGGINFGRIDGGDGPSGAMGCVQRSRRKKIDQAIAPPHRGDRKTGPDETAAPADSRR